MTSEIFATIALEKAKAVLSCMSMMSHEIDAPQRARDA
jgi:hypothetical protein